MNTDIFSATLLGVIEGLTEFIPVSSTAHLLLVGDAIGFDSTGNSFEVLIQLGAVLAVVTVYFAKLWQLFVTIPSNPDSRRFVLSILLAFIPAAVIGAFAHSLIKDVLFESPAIICIALIVGGFILLAIDRMKLERRYDDVMQFPPSLCLKIGFFQCLAMIPGTSRSGATIAGALLLGAEKRAAAEFSFFLAMPTMAGAFAFVCGVVVVRYLLDFISKHGFAPFAYWRILVGTIGLGAILAFG